MRILTITNCYPPHYYGGYELTCHDVMQRFIAAGHEVTVIASTVRVPGAQDVTEPNVCRDLTPYWDWEEAQPNVPTTPWGRWSVERRNTEALRRVMARSAPDVVSVWHMIGLSMSLLGVVAESGVPAVVTVANDWLMQAPTFDGWLRLWRHWRFARPRTVGGIPTRQQQLSRFVIDFVSDFTRQQAIRNSCWQIPDDAPVVPPGIDPADFPIVTPSQRRWMHRLLYVGRVDPAKGIETLLRATARLPVETHLTVVGGGSLDYQSQLATLADELGLGDRVRWDRRSRHELRDAYLKADAVIFPSEWEEPFGLVPLEAMACGVPVVATGTGGSGEFLRDESNCLLFRAGDQQALADAVERMASDATLRGRLVAGGRQTAERYTIDRYADELLELHHRVLGPVPFRKLGGEQ